MDAARLDVFALTQCRKGWAFSQPGYALAFSEDGHLLASASGDTTTALGGVSRSRTRYLVRLP